MSYPKMYKMLRETADRRLMSSFTHDGYELEYPVDQIVRAKLGRLYIVDDPECLSDFTLYQEDSRWGWIFEIQPLSKPVKIHLISESGYYPEFWTAIRCHWRMDRIIHELEAIELENNHTFTVKRLRLIKPVAVWKHYERYNEQIPTASDLERIGWPVERSN